MDVLSQLAQLRDTCMVAVCGCQMRTSGPLEQMVVSHRVGALEEQQVLMTSEPPLQLLRLFLTSH